MGNLMKEALPEGGQVALFVGQLDVANARERQQGVLEVLAGSNITVVDTYTDRGEPANAKSVVTDVLSFEIRSDNLEEVEADIAAKLKLKEELEDRYGK